MISTEKETQKACLELLEAKRIFHYRQNTGAMKTEHGFYRFGSKGAPDIVCVINGIYVGLEVKDLTRGKLNSNQEIFKKSLEKAGGIYLVIRSIDELIKFLDKQKRAGV